MIGGLTGHVKWFDQKRGYGFILSDDGHEYFFHYSGLMKDGFKTIEDGAKVLFDITNASKGWQAFNILEVG